MVRTAITMLVTPPTLQLIVVTALVLTLVFDVLERHWGEHAPRWGRDKWINMGYWAMSPPMAAVVRAVCLLLLIPIPWQGVVGSAPLWLLWLLYFVAADLVGYWLHRLMHTRLFWNFHVIHHSTVELDWVGGIRHHPLEWVIIRVLGFIPLYLMGFPLYMIAAGGPLVEMFDFYAHADLKWNFGPFRRFFVSPAYHRWHHVCHQSAYDRNFARMLPIWDMMFGTYAEPPAGHDLPYGVDRVPPDLAGQLVFPFSPGRTARAAVDSPKARVSS